MLQKKLVLILALAASACCTAKHQEKETTTANTTTVIVVEEVIPMESDKVVFFKYDSYALSDDATALLDKQVVTWMKNNPTRKVTIIGNTDERGSEEYNLKLGQRRAEAVKKYLTLSGIEASRITAKSYGKLNPVDPNHNEEAWAKNRRTVTISIDRE
ncbi:MAG: peptidoglycan-associated lipoprotein Pal [Pseudomonadota bacterium]